jgi:hypothetical protein
MKAAGALGARRSRPIVRPVREAIVEPLVDEATADSRVAGVRAANIRGVTFQAFERLPVVRDVAVCDVPATLMLRRPRPNFRLGRHWSRRAGLAVRRAASSERAAPGQGR